MLSNLDSPPYQRQDSAKNGVLSGYFPAWLNSLFEMNEPSAGRLISWPGMMVLLAVMGGCAVAFADFNALYICISLIAIAFIMIDFRVGVLLLIIVMPIYPASTAP